MALNDKILYVVHCIDAEGPLDETLDATFVRLKSIFGIDLKATKDNLRKIQQKEIAFGGLEESIAKTFSPELLAYNRSWNDIDVMMDRILSKRYRHEMEDDFGGGWVYSWHCLDHMEYIDNVRSKEIGYGKIFSYYVGKLRECSESRDEINWHFHPNSLTRQSTHAATSYVNSYSKLIQILCRRILIDEWFPVVNRPGFHSERPDSHLFLEQWIPFDYANQFHEINDKKQIDLMGGRFGDWRRATSSWRGYHPDFFDYQVSGLCRRKIFRCLNVGTRVRLLEDIHVQQAFNEAREYGSAILAFSDHDFRNIELDVNYIRKLLKVNKINYPDVKIKFVGAEAAAVESMGVDVPVKIHFNLKIDKNKLIVELTSGELFGPQPFLAIQTRDGQYFHDNFDCEFLNKVWSYTFDDMTLNIEEIHSLGVASSGRYGGYFVNKLIL